MITKMDECVRKSWQLHPDQLEINHPWWQSGMEKLTDLIAGRLGYKGVPLQCMLYKLLVYGWGRKWFEDSQMMLPKLKSRVGVFKRHFDDDQQ
ncbi:hypothetical protein PHMEG_0009402 [Phytophthora megakarya]|uniref:Uncharacterized protein n=1 Tax=Phytophthora megakarya TaxID=4795 RepID=A0A225WI21_9STRA|nr:hypothetical protein PHMEG_0009402 [Phytophthora megakarya]